MRKICIVSPSLKMGGIARVLSELANYWSASGYDVKFISCLAGDKLYKLNDNIKFVEPKFHRKKSLINKLIYYPKLIFYIRKQVLNFDSEFVLSFGDTFNPLVIIALLKSNRKIIISDRTSPDYKYPFPNKLLKNLFYKHASGFIAQTHIMKECRRQEYPSLKIKIIPNPLKMQEKINLKESQNIILYVGRFAVEKGPDRLIESFAKTKYSQDWKLIMAGEGPLLEEMKELALKLGVTQKINFLGKVEDVNSLYRSASIYVLPSRLEGFPNSLCEAMSFGLPCVTFDSIPFKEIFSNNLSGIAVKDGDINKLADTIDFLMTNIQTRINLGHNAHAEIQKLSIQNISEKYLNFFNTL